MYMAAAMAMVMAAEVGTRTTTGTGAARPSTGNWYAAYVMLSLATPLHTRKKPRPVGAFSFLTWAAGRFPGTVNLVPRFTELAGA